jgi:DNA-binding NarL/FixJ family response regulator
VKVIIADDHKILCDGLRVLLEKQPGVEVVGVAENGREVVRMAGELQPDLVIMDFAMPELNGIEATRQILMSNKKVKVVALSMHSDRRYVCGMLSAGVSGYLLKDCAFEELGRALKAVSENKTYLSPAIAGIVVESFRNQEGGEGSSRVSAMSPREREVFQLLAEGCTMRDIALKLHLSIKTIETYRRQIMEKLEVQSLAELTKYAIREGLTTLGP